MNALTAQRYVRNAYRFTYGHCPLCGRADVRLITDHCHQHGWIRGQICESCNQSLRHEERRHSMAELLGGRCWHNHRSDQARERCREADRKRNTRRIEDYHRCPDCDRIGTRDSEETVTL